MLHNYNLLRSQVQHRYKSTQEDSFPISSYDENTKNETPWQNPVPDPIQEVQQEWLNTEDTIWQE